MVDANFCNHERGVFWSDLAACDIHGVPLLCLWGVFTGERATGQSRDVREAAPMRIVTCIPLRRAISRHAWLQDCQARGDAPCGGKQ